MFFVLLYFQAVVPDFWPSYCDMVASRLRQADVDDRQSFMDFFMVWSTRKQAPQPAPGPAHQPAAGPAPLQAQGPAPQQAPGPAPEASQLLDDLMDVIGQEMDFDVLSYV